MRRLIAVAALLMASSALAQMGPGSGDGSRGGGGPEGGRRGGGMGMHSGGPMMRSIKPIKREKLDKAVTGMFHQGDTNHDGLITLEELNAVFAARREVLIRARFERIDSDHNGTVSFGEFTAWQRQMGSAASSEDQLIAAPHGGPVSETIAPQTDDDAEGRALTMLIEPLSAMTIVSANVNYDAGMSLDELLAYERKRFDAADADKDGELSMDEMRSLRMSHEKRMPGRPGGDIFPCAAGDDC
jgi:Ca2+-binding EF-hand superfamily protein